MTSRAWVVPVTAWRSQIVWRSKKVLLVLGTESADCISSHGAQLEHTCLKMAVSAATVSSAEYAGVAYISLFFADFDPQRPRRAVRSCAAA